MAENKIGIHKVSNDMKENCPEGTYSMIRLDNGKEVPFTTCIRWDQLEQDILLAIEVVRNEKEINSKIPIEVIIEIQKEKNIHLGDKTKALKKGKAKKLMEMNDHLQIPGKWRRTPYPQRKYELLSDYAFTKNVSENESTELQNLLNTTLKGFLGQAYNYDDHTLIDDWMSTFKDGKSKAPSDDDVTRLQIEVLMDALIVQVQDRVCNDNEILLHNPLELGKDILEVPVWGIDSFTRRLIELVLLEKVEDPKLNDKKLINKFIECTLLPTINNQTPDKAHDVRVSLSAIAEVQKQPANFEYASIILKWIEEYGHESFKIHPKGTGVICINPNGIRPHKLAAHYLGELYPPYRWCERMDVVEQAQKTYQLKPTLPDFYNILLERPRHDPNGYGLLYVDASQRANVGSSCSHSCDPNCTSAVVARNGKLVIAMTTLRQINFGEELTMDYCSVTNSDVEWRAAVCLCGMASCRGTFLQYATQDEMQQVLNLNCGPMWRYAALQRACVTGQLDEVDEGVLERHGMKEAALGKGIPNANGEDELLWLRKFAAANLRFVEFERRALPCSLMRLKSNGKMYDHSYRSADLDARMVMEQRIQSMICCVSTVNVIFSKMGNTDFTMDKRKEDNYSSEKIKKESYPIISYTVQEATMRVWEKLFIIPELLEEYMIQEVELCNIEKTTKSIMSPKKLGGGDHQSPGTPTRQSDQRFISPVKPHTPSKLELLIQEVVRDIQNILDTSKPLGLSGLKKLCLAIREKLKPLENYSTNKARIGQLRDVLVFWAHTSYFSYVQEFDEIESDPIMVFARDLGTNIQRSKIFKPELSGLRSAKKELRSVRGKGMEKKSDSHILDYWSDENHGQSASRSTVDSNMLEVTSLVKSKPIEPIDRDENHVDLDASNTMDELEASMTTNSSQSEIDIQISESDLPHPVTETSDSATVSPSISEDDRMLVNVDKAVVVETARQIQPVETTSSDPILTPDEPVFMGSRKYHKLFIFWQLMNWFTAGTDYVSDTENDLFGCVELPDPASCFGTADVVYGLKHREILFSLLNDEKKQTLPWPIELRSTFTKRFPIAAASTSPQKSVSKGLSHGDNYHMFRHTPMYGSPMLDVALGKVTAVKQLLTFFQKEIGINPMKSKSIAKGKENPASGKEVFSDFLQKPKAKKNNDEIQYDNILPQELPTNWVQCELCKKWRRVAWNIDQNTLSDNWSCQQNTWDPETANCDIAQDSFDPSLENTVQISTIHNKIDDPEKYKVGTLFDVYCPVNCIYYVGIVKKLKYSKNSEHELKMLIHFMGWSSSFDEWIDISSDRIQPINLHTDSSTTDPRAQERWQGIPEMDVQIRGAPIRSQTKKRKSESNAKKLPLESKKIKNRVST